MTKDELRQDAEDLRTISHVLTQSEDCALLLRIADYIERTLEVTDEAIKAAKRAEIAHETSVFDRNYRRYYEMAYGMDIEWQIKRIAESLLAHMRGEK